MRGCARWLAVAIIIESILCACNGKYPTPMESPTDIVVSTNQYVGLDELYETVPTTSTSQNDWEQWEEKYQGMYVRCKGRFDAVSINPKDGKLFLIISVFRQDNQLEISSTQLAFWVEDAYTISLEEEEGSFLVNGLYIIKLGNNYDLEGKVVQFSRFDATLVSAGYSDIVIIQGKVRDVKFFSENVNGISNNAYGEENDKPTEISPELENFPSHPTAFYSQDLSETSISPIWNRSDVSCDEKPIYSWSSPGTYLYKVITKSNEDYYVTVTQSSILQKPSEDQCQMPWPNFGNRMLELPEIGVVTYFPYEFCDIDRSRPPGSISITVSGFIGFGTYQVLKVDTYQKYNFLKPPNYPQGSFSTSEQYVCGIGLVESHTLHIGKYQHRDFQLEYGLELISFTPTSTNLPLVRFILVDIQLGNLAEEYRTNNRYEEIAHALRLWDAGIRVENIEEFEWKLIDGQWQIVFKGTKKTIVGNDIVLTSDR